MTQEKFTYATFEILPAQPADVGDILALIQALADYERMSDECVGTEAMLHKWIFEEKKAEVVMGKADGKAVGFALFFTSFSTFLAKPGIYLEDLFVKPHARGCGFGKKLLAHLADLVVQRGYGRLEWTCLDWNKPSIDFYLPLGAKPMDEWTTYRLTGDPLENLAATTR